MLSVNANTLTFANTLQTSAKRIYSQFAECSKYYTSIRLIQTLAKNNVQTIHFQRSFGSLHSEGLFPVEVLKLRLKYFGSEYPQAYATSLTGIDVDSNR